ncbi:hypothetical protein C8046_10205 [Serinibacter arcticus]|uniref:VWFA domain-containing protein n=1 Tax=Serinibacter arcticus TaxID=1655435 RepID=A0A2U1ZVG5_9MICO|nr:SpaA isopeptide-forming pilin-related protein [Serinibacter arcticus]PWD50969.1 hypothetical protein C8046_10205 [Serinibacter arcticus]
MAGVVSLLVAAGGLTLPATAAPVPAEATASSAESAPTAVVPDPTTAPTTSEPASAVTVAPSEAPVVEPLEVEEVAAQERAPELDATRAADSLVSPMAVPSPGSGQAVLNVKVGGDRIGGNGISATGVAGVTLRLSDGSNNPSGWASFGWATCISDSAGDCSFVIPLKTSGTSDAAAMRSNIRPYVHQISAPTGYSLVPQLRTGSGSGGSDDLRPLVYRFDGSMSSGATYLSTTRSDFMITSSSEGDEATSAGYWPVRRDNPSALQQCGLDVAVLFDLSGSIGSALPTAKAAVNQFTNAFVGTPSRMAVFSFDLTSPASGGANHPNLLPVRTTAEATTFKNQYSGWSTGSGTNWDAGLYQVAQAQASGATNRRYDMLVVLTDGNPTSFGTGNNPSQDGDNRLRDIEAGVFSANLVKASGTRIVAVGVGGGAGGDSNRNLIAISGPQQGTDYFQAGDYNAAASYLAALAKGNCEGSIDVVKRVIPATAQVPANPTKAQLDAISAPAAGWVFNATSANPAQVSIGTPAGPWTTDAQGHATVPLKFPTPQAVGPITFTETQKAGYELQPVNGQNAVCLNTNTNLPVAIAGAGTAATPGATLPVAVNTAIECTVYNRQVPPPAALATTKTITQVNGATATSATSITPGDVLRYSVAVTNTGGVAGTTVLTETVPTGTRYTGTGEGWVCATPAVANSTCTRSVSVNPAATVTSTFTVTADAPLPATLTQIRNVVTSSIGTCSTCEVTNPVTPPASLATGKVLTQLTRGGVTWAPEVGDTVAPTDVLAYTVSVSNTGGLPGTTLLTETVPPGTTYTGPASQGWTCAATPAVGGTSCTQSVTVVAGATATRTFTVTVASPLEPSLASIRNVVTSSVGTCTTCSTTNPVPPQWSVVKTSLRGTAELPRGATVQPGEVLTYRVTATNASANPVTGVMLVDDLSGVLDDATFVAGSAQLVVGAQAPIAVATPVGATLTSPVFTLPAGTTAVLSYRVTVDADAWSAELRNVVVGHGDYPPATCAPAGGTSRLVAPSAASFAPFAVGDECTTTNVTPSPLQILKVGENAAGAVVPMDGSAWSIWTAATGGTAVLATVPGATAGYPAAPVPGLFRTTMLAPGTYWLEESRALAGFQLLPQRVAFTVTATGSITLGAGGSTNITVVTDAPGYPGVPTIRVEDVPRMALPEAGARASRPGTPPVRASRHSDLRWRSPGVFGRPRGRWSEGGSTTRTPEGGRPAQDHTKQ